MTISSSFKNVSTLVSMIVVSLPIVAAVAIGVVPGPVVTYGSSNLMAQNVVNCMRVYGLGDHVYIEDDGSSHFLLFIDSVEEKKEIHPGRTIGSMMNDCIIRYKESLSLSVHHGDQNKLEDIVLLGTLNEKGEEYVLSGAFAQDSRGPTQMSLTAPQVNLKMPLLNTCPNDPNYGKVRDTCDILPPKSASEGI